MATGQVRHPLYYHSPYYFPSLSAAQSLPYSPCLSPPWLRHGRMFYCKRGKTPSIRASKTSMASPPLPCKLAPSPPQHSCWLTDLLLARRCSALPSFYYVVKSLYTHQVDRMSNTLVQLRRESPWAQKYRGVMGPGAAFFYFGPAGTPGHIIYGNAPSQPMATTLRRKRSSEYVRSELDLGVLTSPL